MADIILRSTQAEDIVQTADSTANVFSRDVVGNKTDAAVTTAGTTKSLVAYAKGALSLVATADAAIDAIQADIGDPSGGGTTLYAQCTAIKTATDQIGTLVNTGAGAETLAAIIGDVNSVDIATQLNNIYSPHTWTGSISTYAYTDAGGEQTVLTLSPGTDMYEINCIFLDLVNMTKNGTIKVYLKIDGTTYREISSDSFVVATDSDGVWIDFKGMIMDDLKVTYTEAEDEAAERSIPYQYIIRSI